MSTLQSYRALVLSGGSIKGAFQAGAVCGILRNGFIPDGIYGISVGALNGAFLANLAGDAARNGREPDWPELGQALWNLWSERIVKPSVIARKRWIGKLLLDGLLKRFSGLVNTRALHKLVRDTLVLENLHACPVTFKVGAVNIKDGTNAIIGQTHNRIIDYVIASTAIPIVMPVSKLNHTPFVDGGVRDVALFGEAIDDKATEIVCILCQPEKMDVMEINCGDLKDFAFRIFDIITNETVNNDIRMFDTINRIAPKDGAPITEGDFTGKRYLKSTIIRPEKELDIELTEFKRDDILRLMEMGKEAAAAVLP